MNRRTRPLLRVLTMGAALLVGALAMTAGPCPAQAAQPTMPMADMRMSKPCNDDMAPAAVTACLLICQAVLPEPIQAAGPVTSESLPVFSIDVQRLKGMAFAPQAPPPR